MAIATMEQTALERPEPVAMQTRSAITTPDEFDLLRMQAIAVAQSGMMGSKGLPREEAESDAIAKVLVARELGLPPVSAALSLLYMIPTQGGKRLTMSAQSMMALIRKSQLVDVSIDEDEGYCEVTMTRRDSGESYTTRWDVAKAKASGLYGKDVWTKYQAAMLRSKAVGENARFSCPDILCGVYAVEEFDLTEEDAREAERAPRVVEEHDETPTGHEAEVSLRERFTALVDRGADREQLTKDFNTIRQSYRVGAKAPTVAELPAAGIRALVRMLDKAEAALPTVEDVAEGDFDTDTPPAPGHASRLVVPKPDAARWPRGENTPVTHWRAICTDAGIDADAQASIQVAAFGTARPADSPDEMAALLIATDEWIASNGTHANATDGPQGDPVLFEEGE